MKQCLNCHIIHNQWSNFCSQQCCDYYLIKLMNRQIELGVYVPQIKRVGN